MTSTKRRTQTLTYENREFSAQMNPTPLYRGQRRPRSASPSGPTDRRRRCLLPPTHQRPAGPTMHPSDAHGDASDTKKGALSKHPLTDAARAHTHHRCISQMQIEPSLSLRCGKNRSLPFLAHAVVRDVALHQCACDSHHGGHRFCSYWTDAVGAHVE